jgi:hypothetical protein
LPGTGDAAGFHQPKRQGRNAGLQEPKLREIAAVQWQIRGFPRRYHAANRRAEIDCRGVGGHIHGASNSANSQRDGLVDGAVNVNPDMGRFEGSEASGNDAQIVVAYRQIRKSKASIGRRFLGRREARSGVARRYFRSGNTGRRGIAYSSFECSGGVLSKTDGDTDGYRQERAQGILYKRRHEGLKEAYRNWRPAS